MFVCYLPFDKFILDNHVEDIVGSISQWNPWQPNDIINNIDDVKEAFVAKKWDLFHL